MAWQDEMVPILRHLIDDTAETKTYTDSMLENIIVVAAQLSTVEISFDNDYMIDVTQMSISPDPTAGTRDNAFIALISLKAACLTLKAEAKASAGESIRVTDGPSTIDTTSRSTMRIERSKDMCEQYAKAKQQHLAGNARFVAAILGPYTNDSVTPIPWNF